mmetsp:Transcript_11236/g.24109  ORF Transcript_11236/g.24109 Transcript_11236/m.24109 type:complete len:201 (-) Transcript_11236:141-743(-)
MGRRGQGGTGSPSRGGGDGDKIVDGKLSFLQVTRTFHQEHMPFSAQCYGFAGGGWRDTWAGASDNTLRAPVRSEEIGADWGDVFQRLQVVPLQYSVPQVSPRFSRFFEPYVPMESPKDSATAPQEDLWPLDPARRRVSAALSRSGSSRRLSRIATSTDGLLAQGQAALSRSGSSRRLSSTVSVEGGEAQAQAIAVFQNEK